MGCAWGKPDPSPPPVAAPTKTTQTVANVSSATAAPDGGPGIVGHNRKLEDEYVVGKQIGKYVALWPSLGTVSRFCIIVTPILTVELLPRGHYGYVFEGVQKSTGRRVAVKKIDRSLCTPFRIQEEVCCCAVVWAAVCGAAHPLFRAATPPRLRYCATSGRTNSWCL